MRPVSAHSLKPFFQMNHIRSNNPQSMAACGGMGMNIETAIGRIKEAVGPRGWIADPGDQEPFLVESRGLYRGATRLVVRPASTTEVAAVVRICAEGRLPIVPQGGNTGPVGGAVPPEDGRNIVLASAA